MRSRKLFHFFNASVFICTCIVVLMASMGCEETVFDDPDVSSSRLALSQDNARILGFEAPASDWTAPVSLSASGIVSQGSASLAVVPNGWTEISSKNISSLGATNATLELDVRVPEPVLNWGEIRVIVRIPSKGIYHQELGSKPLTGIAPRTYTTMQFPLSSSMMAALGGTYSDLQIVVVLNGPRLSQPYLLDNIVVTAHDVPDADTENGETDTEASPPDPSETERMTFSFEIPASTPLLNELAISASDYMRLADRVSLDTTAAVLRGNADVGNDARTAYIEAKGNVKIGQRTYVSGDVVAGGGVQLGYGSFVTGTVKRWATIDPPVKVQWTVDAPVTDLGDVYIEPDQTRDLQPGRYGVLSVKSRSTLTIHSGVYVVDQFQIEPEAIVRVDNSHGPVQMVVQGGFYFRGSISSATGGIPQTIFVINGTSDVFVEAPFTGVVVAPSAAIRFQAAKPEGHRVLAVGKSVWLEPDTVIRRMPCDWGTIIGPEQAPVPPNAPIHAMTEDDLGLTAKIPPGGDGSPVTTTATAPTPQTYTVPEDYTLKGGNIGNGTVILTADGVSCTYQGMASTSEPETPEDLIRGTVLQFKGCTDGQPAGTPRTATTFEVEVDPIPNFPATVQPPLSRPNVCSDTMEILNPVQTWQMRESFSWNDAHKVAGMNADGTPTLYYAWIYIRDREEALALKKLFIHVLKRPLFDEELVKYTGKCGSFTNPGDGDGMFVPAVIPGKTYNRLIDALTSDDVEGDRVIFDAVIIRDVPAGARNANGSINLQVLGQSGFRYLDYEVDPFKPSDQIVLDMGGGSKLLTDVLEWVGQTARDVGEVVTGVLNEIDQLFRGEITVELWMHALTQDPLFSNDVMRRGWGKFAGQEMGAPNMQVKILQRMFNSFIPTTAQGDTDMVGHVTIDATKDGETRGRGLCIELMTDAALVTDFLLASEICDLRAYDSLTSTNAQVLDFRLARWLKDTQLRLHIDNTRLLGLYQSDDVYRYSKDVMGYTPKRARILSGYWGTTFSPTQPTGEKQLYAPCLNFPNSVSDALFAAAAGVGALAGAAVGSVVPGVGSAVGAAVGSIAAGTFASVVSNSDIVMSTDSNLRNMRAVMSHEYGHYMFCNMLYDANPDAVDHVVWGTIIRGKEVNFPLRYTNEAMADYFMGQVASGADYKWLPNSHDTGNDQFCADDQTPCWEENLNGDADGTQNIGRVATMLLDVFDGQGAGRTDNVATDADAWHFDPSSGTLSFNTNATGDNHNDTHLERVHMPASRIRTFAAELAYNMEPFVEYNFNDENWEAAGYAIDDHKIRVAVDAAMEGESWCDRCRVLALHEPGANRANIQELWNTCQSDGDLVDVLGPAPDADLRLDADTCEVCPDGQTSDQNGQCQVCADTQVGNKCEVCGPDVVLDGSTMDIIDQSYDVNQSGAGDRCPNYFTVEVRNPGDLFARGLTGFDAMVIPSPATPANCEREFEMTFGYTPIGGAYQEEVQQTVGDWPDCFPEGPMCVEKCNSTPYRIVRQADTGDSIIVTSPAMPNTTLYLYLSLSPPNPA